MCLLCIEVTKGTMTTPEIARAYHEAVIDPEHWDELLQAIDKHADMSQVVEALNELYKRGVK